MQESDDFLFTVKSPNPGVFGQYGLTPSARGLNASSASVTQSASHGSNHRFHLIYLFFFSFLLSQVPGTWLLWISGVDRPRHAGLRSGVPRKVELELHGSDHQWRGTYSGSLYKMENIVTLG